MKGLRLVLVGAGVLFPVLMLAGVWPQEKGGGYFQLSFTYLRYHELIDNFSLSDGFQVHGLQRYVNDHTLNGYLEYGVTDRFTVIGSVPYKLLRTENELLETEDYPYSGDTIQGGSLNTLGNIDLGGKYLLHQGKYVWSAQLMAGMNTSSYQPGTGLRSGYDAWYFTPRILVGRGWGKAYFSSSLGFRFKTNGYAYDLISDNEVGYKWQRGEEKKTWFVFVFGADIPVTKGSYDDGNSTHTGLYRDEEGFVDPGLKINHYFNEHLALNLSTIGAIWARHGGNEMTVTAGVSWEW